MKKSLTALVLAVLMLLPLAACGGSQSSSSTTAVSSEASSLETIPETISEDEARALSLALYENGYLLHHGLYWGKHMDQSQYIEIDGKQYCRLNGYDTWQQLEAALLTCFTSNFVQRTKEDLFSGEWTNLHMVEQEGYIYLYYSSGIGGTIVLFTENIMIEDLTEAGWTFNMYATDMHTNEATEETMWTFIVVKENDTWVIEQMSYPYGVFYE